MLDTLSYLQTLKCVTFRSLKSRFSALLMWGVGDRKTNTEVYQIVLFAASVIFIRTSSVNHIALLIIEYVDIFSLSTKVSTDNTFIKKTTEKNIYMFVDLLEYLILLMFFT